MADTAQIPPPDRLAEAAALLRRAGHPDMAGLVDAVHDGAGLVEVARALVARDGGPDGRQRRDRRNRAYLGLRKLTAAGLSPSAAGTSVERAYRRYAGSADGRRDRRVGRDGLPPGDIVRALKFEVLASGAKPLTARSLRLLFQQKQL